MKIKILIILLLTISISCKSDNDNIEDYPECLQPIIISILERPVQNPRAKIEKWLYFEQEVYEVIAQNFPDGQSFIITLECEDICSTGGIDGEFNDCEKDENSVLLETIWTDPR